MADSLDPNILFNRNARLGLVVEEVDDGMVVVVGFA